MSCLRPPITAAPAAGSLRFTANAAAASSLPLVHLLHSFVSKRQPRVPAVAAKARRTKRDKTLREPREDAEDVSVEIVGEEEFGGEGFSAFPFVTDGFRGEEEGGAQSSEEEVGGFSSSSSGYRARDDDKDFDRDPELVEILGSSFDDPQKAQSRVEERIRRKRGKILHSKTGSATPMKVTFNKFDFSNSYIWFEFYNAPLTKDITLICDAIRSWHIVGRLGGCNSMNMQLSQAPLETKRPTYDAIEGANVSPTTFYNISDFEIQDNLARIWVDIGTTEPLLLDVLINALTCISSDFVGIKQVVFGGSEFENWKENLKTEDVGYSSHKI